MIITLSTDLNNLFPFKFMDNFQLGNRDLLRELNENLKSLNNSIGEFSKTSDSLQRKLIFWTKIVALAVAFQAAVIVIQIYLNFR